MNFNGYMTLLLLLLLVSCIGKVRELIQLNIPLDKIIKDMDKK